MATSRSQPTSEAGYRSKILFRAKDGKTRHGVVLRVIDGRPLPPYLRLLAPTDLPQGALLLVVAGTSQEPRPHGVERHVCVKERSRECNSLRLDCTTWFKSNMLEVIPRSRVIRVDGQAPPNLAQQLEGLIPMDLAGSAQINEAEGPAQTSVATTAPTLVPEGAAGTEPGQNES